MVPPPFQLEGTPLPNTIPINFEMFYRACLRRVAGYRLRSSDLMATYVDWSSRGPGAVERLSSSKFGPAISYHQMQRYMLALGHVRIKSNGIQYLDVALARDFPDLEPTFCIVQVPEHVGPSMIGDALATIDAAVDQLHRVRRVLTGETPRS